MKNKQNDCLQNHRYNLISCLLSTVPKRFTIPPNLNSEKLGQSTFIIKVKTKCGYTFIQKGQLELALLAFYFERNNFKKGALYNAQCVI